MAINIEDAIAERQTQLRRLQAELEHLRETQRILQNGSSATAAVNPPGRAEPEKPQATAEWAKHLPAVFSGKGKTAGEIHKGLVSAGATVSLAALYQWLKRAQKRGEIKRKQKKFYLQPGDNKMSG